MNENTGADTAERGPFAPAVDAWQQWLRDLRMGPDGLFQVELHCLSCGKLLNADGNHPAEIHAGCYNGLCYGCTGAPAYVAQVAVLDGCLKVSWPPHCPSWRRNREDFYAYPGCEVCGGLGVGGSYPKQCGPCLERYSGHPLREMDYRYGEMVMRRAQDIYTRALCRAAGLPKRCAYKRQQDAIAALPRELRKEIATPIKARADRLLTQHARRVSRLHIREWQVPPRGAFLQGQGSCPEGLTAPLRVIVTAKPPQRNYEARITRDGLIEVSGFTQQCRVDSVSLTDSGDRLLAELLGHYIWVNPGDKITAGGLQVT